MKSLGHFNARVANRNHLWNPVRFVGSRVTKMSELQTNRWTVADLISLCQRINKKKVNKIRRMKETRS